MDESVAVQILSMMQAMQQELKDHMADEQAVLEGIHSSLLNFRSAIPGEDYMGHALYHSSIIERNKWITQLCKDILRDVAKYGLVGALVWGMWHLGHDLAADLAAKLLTAPPK